MRNEPTSVRGRLAAWFGRHERAMGIALTVSALALLAMAVVLGWAMFARGKPSTADLGSSSEPSVSASAASALAASASATPVPTPAFKVPAGILPPNSRAVVTLDGLRVRQRPGLNETVLDTLPAGTVVEVDGWGPKVVDGIDWYDVSYDDHPPGYAAVGAGEIRYLELLPSRCIAGEPDLAALKRLTAWEQLACFGKRSLTVTGTYGCICGLYYPADANFEPSWLAGASLAWFGEVTLRLPPEAGLHFPPLGSILRVTGHFSDPASTACVLKGAYGGAGPDPRIAELYCREQFVVDAYEIIGTDPDFGA
jgi:Bacterial SH3 domain